MAARLNELLDQVAAEHAWQIVAREVMPDHVHLLVQVRPVDWPAQVAGRLDGPTWPVWRSEFDRLGGKKGLWSKSSVAASVGSVSEAAAGRSVERQWDEAG